MRTARNLTVDDCDDSDSSLGAVASDADCDGTLTADDCDDSDATSTGVAEDADCDGFITANDCDDSDASVYPFAGDTPGDGIDGDCDGADCAAGSDGSTYFAVCEAFSFGSSTTHADAITYCTDAGYDGLAEIFSTSENTYVAELWPTAPVALGATDSASQGTWVWDSGATWSFTAWASDQPSGGSTEDCLRLRSSGQNSSVRYTWSDANCSAIQYVGCEIR